MFLANFNKDKFLAKLGCYKNFGNGHKTEPVTVELTLETHFLNRRLYCLDEMRRIYFYVRLLSLY
jgi:hypothetical protein